MTETILRIKKTQIEMMKDRGYDTADDEARFKSTIKDGYSNKNMDDLEIYDINKFNKVYFPTEQKLNNLSIIYTHRETGRNVYVYYFDRVVTNGTASAKIKKEQIEELFENIGRYMGSNIDTIVLISQVPLKSDGIDALMDIPNYVIHFFLHENLLSNPTKHKLVPKHKLLNMEESINFIKTNNIKRDKLQKICFDDSIAKYYGAIPGQIFEIKRKRLNIPSIIDSEIVYRTVTVKSIYHLG